MTKETTLQFCTLLDNQGLTKSHLKMQCFVPWMSNVASETYPKFLIEICASFYRRNSVLCNMRIYIINY